MQGQTYLQILRCGASSKLVLKKVIKVCSSEIQILLPRFAAIQPLFTNVSQKKGKTKIKAPNNVMRNSEIKGTYI